METKSAGNAAGVTIENLGISFGATEVLRGVNLEIEPGEFFTFLGPSGSGKSTLLRAIAGFGPQPTGRILIGEDEITNLPPWQRNVGMVFQSYALWPHMTVRRNVAFGLEEHRIPAGEIRSRVDAALNLVGLREFAVRRPSQLSGGQQQRVALARTIVVEPRVLLLDEPLSNLDANLRVQMRREILELQRELALTTIFVTHDQEEANTISDRIAVLNDKVIQQVGTPLDLYDNPANRFVADFLGTANLIEGRIETANGKTVFHASDGVAIPVDGDRLEFGNVRIAMFRPQNVTIALPPNQWENSDGVFSGRIAHREFLGSTVRYAVKVRSHSILVDVPHLAEGQPFGAGDEVVVGIDPDRVRFLTA